MSINWPATLALSELDKLRLESAVDESLRSRLMENPAEVLQERGIDIPDGVDVRVVEDSENCHTITLPPFVGASMAEAQMNAAANNATWACTTCTATTPICAGSLASLICLGSK